MTKQELDNVVNQINFGTYIGDNARVVIQVIDEHYRLWEHIYCPYDKYWVRELKRSVRRFDGVVDIRVYIVYYSMADSMPYGYWDCINGCYEYL